MELWIGANMNYCSGTIKIKYIQAKLLKDED